MPRPFKCRRVEMLPAATFFKPAGIPLTELETVVLSVEELESLRLKDLEGMEQEECAQRMGVSRPTFQRILGAARQKVAAALVHGKAIRVEGGNYQLAFCCCGCNETTPGKEADNLPCPRCGRRRGGAKTNCNDKIP